MDIKIKLAVCIVVSIGIVVFSFLYENGINKNNKKDDEQ